MFAPPKRELINSKLIKSKNKIFFLLKNKKAIKLHNQFNSVQLYLYKKRQPIKYVASLNTFY